jgi:hypothetical protein
MLAPPQRCNMISASFGHASPRTRSPIHIPIQDEASKFWKTVTLPFRLTLLPATDIS